MTEVWIMKVPLVLETRGLRKKKKKLIHLLWAMFSSIHIGKLCIMVFSKLLAHKRACLKWSGVVVFHVMNR